MESETWPGASSDKKQWMKAITALFLEQEDCDYYALRSFFCFQNSDC